ncbi:PAS domain S-box protein [Flavisolibacter tropicus]|uniref:histidine kinase n=1 Tax=Flavisolibacter tropicus TaxID=1492898 RepID=A0A172TWR2_9BACT|nr:PAS domain S-box protein [Flavisolibacter tropicus]ANE51529.1 hypothetical protein SY85_14470 [Flavisolibacter tropicus]
MAHETPIVNTLPGLDISTLCTWLPSSSVLLQPNAPQYTIVAASAAFGDLMDIPHHLLPGKSYWDLPSFQTSSETVTSIRTSLETIQTHKEHRQVLYGRLPMQQGQEKTVIITHQPVLSTNGTLLYILQTVEDKSTSPQELHAANDSELQLQQLIESVPAILWMTAADGQCTYLNKPWCAITGQTLEEALGYGWLGATHPDDKEAAGNLFIEANKQHTAFTVRYRLRQQDGSYRWVIDKGKPRFDSAGNYLGMIGTVLDIHDQKLAEDRSQNLISIIEASQEFVGLANLDATISFINPAGLRMLGWEGVAGKTVLDAIHPTIKPLPRSYYPFCLQKVISRKRSG